MSLTELVVSPERALYIQTVLYPEREYCGRPSIIANELGTIMKSDRQTAKADAKRAEIGIKKAA